jgi:hypothetical protein
MPRSVEQRLKRTEVTVIAELDVWHVIRDGCLGLSRRHVVEDELCFGIDDFSDKPSEPAEPTRKLPIDQSVTSGAHRVCG